uniref:Uncharacterized protein n=1 Tax=Rhizophora mucronata TaxID=61149 RepID=A0A2P2NC68_RHIMU
MSYHPKPYNKGKGYNRIILVTSIALHSFPVVTISRQSKLPEK